MYTYSKNIRNYYWNLFYTSLDKSEILGRTVTYKEFCRYNSDIKTRYMGFIDFLLDRKTNSKYARVFREQIRTLNKNLLFKDIIRNGEAFLRFAKKINQMDINDRKAMKNHVYKEGDIVDMIGDIPVKIGPAPDVDEEDRSDYVEKSVKEKTKIEKKKGFFARLKERFSRTKKEEKEEFVSTGEVPEIPVFEKRPKETVKAVNERTVVEKTSLNLPGAGKKTTKTITETIVNSKGKHIKKTEKVETILEEPIEETKDLDLPGYNIVSPVSEAFVHPKIHEYDNIEVSKPSKTKEELEATLKNLLWQKQIFENTKSRATSAKDKKLEKRTIDVNEEKIINTKIQLKAMGADIDIPVFDMLNIKLNKFKKLKNDAIKNNNTDFANDCNDIIDQMDKFLKKVKELDKSFEGLNNNNQYIISLKKSAEDAGVEILKEVIEIEKDLGKRKSR